MVTNRSQRSKGASLLEYAVLTGLLSTASVYAALTFGETITGALDSMGISVAEASDGMGGSGGGQAQGDWATRAYVDTLFASLSQQLASSTAYATQSYVDAINASNAVTQLEMRTATEEFWNNRFDALVAAQTASDAALSTSIAGLAADVAALDTAVDALPTIPPNAVFNIKHCAANDPCPGLPTVCLSTGAPGVTGAFTGANPAVRTLAFVSGSWRHTDRSIVCTNGVLMLY
jgi:Flp pilus assembly pilin Flp